MSGVDDVQHMLNDNPLSSAAMRFELFPKPSKGGLGPRALRPLTLLHTESYPLPERPILPYCHQQQVVVDGSGQPLISQGSDPRSAKPKEWESKTYSDGDEGQEEDTWGWEEQ